MGNIESVQAKSLKYKKKNSLQVYESSAISLKRKKIRCLLIGIDYVGTSHRLNGCALDAYNMLNALKKKKNFDVQNTLFLSDNVPAKEDMEELIRCEIPNTHNILSALAWLLSSASSEEFIASNEENENTQIPVYPEAEEDTLCFFYYAGHGSWVWDQNGDESDFRDETLCPVTARHTMDRLIVDDQIRELVNARVSKVKEVTLLAVTDCCHSGSNFDLKYSLEGNCFVSNADAASYTDTSIPILHLAGCRDYQYSAEDASGGYMTQSLLEVVKKSNLNLFHFFRMLCREMARRIPWQEQSIVFSSGKLISAYNSFPL